MITSGLLYHLGGSLLLEKQVDLSVLKCPLFRVPHLLQTRYPPKESLVLGVQCLFLL